MLSVEGITFEWRGKVRGQGRPRFGHGHAYESPKDTEYKEAIAAAYKAAGGVHFGNAPLHVFIGFNRALPDKYKRKTRKVIQADVFKPDIDNLAKSVLDALNGVAWADDNQIIGLEVRKFGRVEQPDNLDLLHVEITDASRWY